MRCAALPAPGRRGHARRRCGPDRGRFLHGQRAHGVRQGGHGAGAGAEPAGVGHGRLDVDAGPYGVRGLHRAPVDPVLAARRRHGPGGGQGLAGPGDGVGVVEVDDGQPGAAGVVGDRCRPPPRRRPCRRVMTSGSVVAAAHAWQGPGQGQGPGVFMFGRPPQALPRAGGAVRRTAPCPRARASTGTPSGARRRAVCRCSLMRPPPASVRRVLAGCGWLGHAGDLHRSVE